MTAPFKTTPYSYQAHALDLSVNEAEFAFFLEMGCGKSKVIIDTACYLRQQGEIVGMLLVVPKGIVANWVHGEFPAHMWDSVPHKIGVWRASAGKKEMGDLFEGMMSKRTSHLRILVMNIDAFSTGRGLEFAKSFLESGPMLMVVDESTTIKSPKARRTKGVLALGKLAKYRRIATGLPIEQSPLDVFSQFEFLRPGILGFRSFYGFRSVYANVVQMVHGPRAYDKVIGYRSLDALKRSMAPHSFRVTKEEALPYLQPKTFTRWEVEMTPEQTRLYKEMRRDAVAKLTTQYGNEEITAHQAVVQLLRLHQILCGHLTITAPDGSKQVQSVPSMRTAALLDILEGLPGKAVIWVVYRCNVDEIAQAVGKVYGRESVVTYFGETSDEDRATAIDRFQNDATCRFFVATAATGGSGLTLTAAETAVYYANTHRAGQRAQSEDRIHRAGQHKAVTYIDMIVPNTIDEKILLALRTKRDLADLIIDGGIEAVI